MVLPTAKSRALKGDPYRILSIRPLVEQDLAVLREKSAPRSRIQSIRDSHHAVARLMASGLSNTQICEATGHSINSLYRYRRDPAVQELVAHYRSIVTEEWREEIDHFQRLAMRNMIKAERMISDTLDDFEDRDELPPLNILNTISEGRQDRFGYGKKSAQTNVNIDYAAALEAAINKQRQLKTIEVNE